MTRTTHGKRDMTGSRWYIGIAICAACAISMPVIAQESDAPETPSETTPAGLLQVPVYAGAWDERSYLLGDLGGLRTTLAEQGVQFDLEWTQIVQSVVDGGREQDTEYGGSLDYNLALDLDKMGVLSRTLINVRAESRYGNTINSIAGPLLPANSDGYFPISDDDSIDIVLTTLKLTHIVSSQFAFQIGKLDTLDGDPNEFASGRGVTQFQNAAFVFNPVTGLSVPYSTLAFAGVWTPKPGVQLSSTILNAADSSTTSGFDNFGDGWMSSTELQLQYQLADKPGGMNFGFVFTGDADFTKLGSRFTFHPGEGIADPESSDTWFVSWSGWQYLYTEEPAEGPLNLTNRVPDLQGVGLFARAGFADEDTNPVDWSVSFGVGGRGVLPSRDDDTFGVGYFYSNYQRRRIRSGPIAIKDNSQGVELFYNIAFTPSANFTLDAQILEDAFPGTDTTVILGARLNIRF